MLISHVRVVFWVLACAWSGAVFAQDNVIINELLASNNSTAGLRDEDNEPQDWIEIHIPILSPVNLQDWGLTDDDGDPFQWRFPATNINAGAYIVIFASEKDR